MMIVCPHTRHETDLIRRLSFLAREINDTDVQHSVCHRLFLLSFSVAWTFATKYVFMTARWMFSCEVFLSHSHSSGEEAKPVFVEV